MRTHKYSGESQIHVFDHASTLRVVLVILSSLVLVLIMYLADHRRPGLAQLNMLVPTL